MKRRDSIGRFASDGRERWRQIIGGSILGGIILGIFIAVALTPVVDVVEAEQLPVEPEEVMIEVVIDWSPERIEQEIRNTFPEAPNTAVAIAICESGLDADIQSGHILSYGREQSFGVFQIHAPDWHNKAIKLGYEDYKTDPAHNIAMARYLYEARGNFGDWTCYNKGMYKKHL